MTWKSWLIWSVVALLSACGKSNPEKPATALMPLFREVAHETGLIFQHTNGATGEFYLPEIMGAGVALIDYDNDGDLDVYFVQGTTQNGNGTPTGNRLFRNELKETGQLFFTDVTEHAGVGHIGQGMGVAVGDYDGDGYRDIYVTSFGPNVLYRNNRNGTFSDVTKQAGVYQSQWSTSAAFLDYDRDGRLDLIVLSYTDFTPLGNKPCYSAVGERDYCTPKAYHPVSARLFHNLGHGKFEDVTQQSGIGASFGPGLGVVCRDFDGDGWTDIYVANDTAPNLLWLNHRDGTFVEQGLASGAAYASDGVARAGMGVTAGDFDGDGIQDLLVTNLVREGATLFRGTGKGQFDDITHESGLTQPTSGTTGFGTKFFDYDNDGLLDLFIANGGATMSESASGRSHRFFQTNQVFHNEGGTFRDVTKQGGPAFDRKGVGRGAAFGDIDNDGDIDIVVTNNDGPALLLLNQVGSRQHWLEVVLKSTDSNRFGIGSQVGVSRTGKPTLWRDVNTDSGYLSAHDARAHFGLGNSSISALQVHWADGSRETWPAPRPDQILELRKGTGHKDP